MNYYRPAPARRRRVNPKRLATVIVVAAAIILAAVFLGYMFTTVTLDADEEAALYENGVFGEGVSVGGIDVSGMTFTQGQSALQALRDDMLGEGSINFKVRNIATPYRYTLEEMGVSVDIDGPLRQAMLHGREGTRWSLKFGSGKPVDFPLERAYDEAVTSAVLSALAAQEAWGQEPEDAGYSVEKWADEDDLRTGGEIVMQESVDGFEVLTGQLIATAQEQLRNSAYGTFDAPVSVVKAERHDGNIPPMDLIGQYTTSYDTAKGSKYERMYNIWKMSDLLNGIRIKSGNTFSINEHVGDRTEEGGWKLAPGIENGDYKDQPGGGICQVSTTMYNAMLRAELQATKRRPHSIPAAYVDPGLDATISSYGGPDFEFENTTDSDVLMIIECDAPARRVTVKFFGNNPRDYYLRFSGEVVREEDYPAPEFIRNDALDPWAIESVLSGQKYKYAEVYVTKYDKETDEVIEEARKVNDAEYKAISPKYEIGSKVPMPEAGTTLEQLTATRDQLKAEEQAALDAEAAAAAAAAEVAQQPEPTPTPTATEPPAPPEA